MAAGTVSGTSTYTGGRGLSFSKDIASRIVDAAEAAKNEKKHQEKIIADGGSVPEKDRKGLFVKALKQEFISNPVNDLKEKFNKKIDKVARVAGLFGSKGEKLQQKLKGKKLKTKTGFNRSGYVYNDSSDDKPDGGAGSGTGGSALVTSLGELVLDVQQIAAAVTSMQGLIATQMNMSVKMSDSLEQIKSALLEQVSLQQEQMENEEMAAREASIEASSSGAGTAKGTSTFIDGGFLDLFTNLKMLSDVINFLKNLPKLFSKFFSGILEKIPGGKFISRKLFGEVGQEAAEGGIKALLGGMLKGSLRTALRGIPFGIGGLLDFGINLMLGESPGRAAAKAVGSTIGSSLGALAAGALGLPTGPGAVATAAIGAVLGGAIGDWLGGAGYDLIAGLFGKKDEKMSAGGGVMVGEAGPEVVTGLQSADAKKSLSGLQSNKGIDEVQDTYYSALAGSTLAITKDFIEGLGPVGAAVAPVIQDDVAKLGREFDIPATSTKVEVGGMGLRQDPQAAKKGEEYLKELVKGTLKNLKGEKDKDKNKNTGGDSSSSGTSGDTSSSDASADASGSSGDSPAGSSGISSGEQTLQSLRQNTNFVNKEQTNLFGQREVVNAVSGTDKSGVRRVKMVDDSGKLSDRYYYNSNGDIFSIDPSLGAKGISQLTLDQIKSYSASGAKFYRNLQSGQVVLTRVPPVGFYNYEKNGIVRSKRVDALAGSNTEGAQVTVTTPLSSLTPIERENFGPLPYGPVADINKIKAEGGIAVTSRRGWRTLNGSRDLHEGTDIGAPSGTKLYAFTDGKVLYKGVDGGYGNYIGWAEKGSGIGHFYGHLSAYGKNVNVGTEFSKGKILGTVGNTGKSSGPHLHWEMADNPNDLGKPKGQGKRKDPLSKYGFMSPFSGTPKPGDGIDSSTTSGNSDGQNNVDGSDMKPEDSAQSMYDSITEGLSGMIQGIALMAAGEQGLIKNEQDYNTYKEQFKLTIPAEATGSTTTPTSSTPGKPIGNGAGGISKPSGSPQPVPSPSSQPASQSRSGSATPSGSSAATLRPNHSP